MVTLPASARLTSLILDDDLLDNGRVVEIGRKSGKTSAARSFTGDYDVKVKNENMPNGVELWVWDDTTRKWLNDDIQLAAQAICLEEMLNRPVPKDAISHASSHRRREVMITADLRTLVEETRRCRECSLKEICQPEALAAQGKQQQQRQRLFNAEE